MIRKFEIINGKYKELEGYLSYDTDSKCFSMKILEDYTGKTPDIFFDELNKRGIVDVPQHLVDMWVQGRVPPPNRQGLMYGLRQLGFDKYDLFELLIYCNAKCQMDSSYIREVSS